MIDRIPIKACSMYITNNNNYPVAGKRGRCRQDRSNDRPCRNGGFSGVWFYFGRNTSFQVSLRRRFFFYLISL